MICNLARLIIAVDVLQVKVVMKEVANTQYVACMNPTAGSFHITPRMQRHFVALAVHMPGPDTMRLATLTAQLRAYRGLCHADSSTSWEQGIGRRIGCVIVDDAQHMCWGCTKT